jgi:uncharacterized protein (DUF2252 family)
MDDEQTAEAPTPVDPAPDQPATEPTPEATQGDRRRATRRGPRATDISSAWAPDEPNPERYVPRPWVSSDERAAIGRAGRGRAPRSGVGTLDLAPDRDPIAILTDQERDRLQDLVPIRHGRMAASAFAFYRGAPAVMAADLSRTPTSGLIVQASGDAHISNFGLFASPERSLVFDANDFDETLPAPWEWDVKRLTASVIIAARENGFTPAEARRCTLDAGKAYREAIARHAGMRLLDIWYDKTTAEDIQLQFEEQSRSTGLPVGAKSRLDALFAKARKKDRLRATQALTTVVDGEWRIVDDPPVVTHPELPGGTEMLRDVFSKYRDTLAQNRRELIERFRFIDFALKVVGVGSVGTRCFIILLEGRDQEDPMILQAKEATASVLEPYTQASEHENHGERVVVGQRLMQTTPDIFLGWTRGPAGRDFYFRQLWDMKGSVDISTLKPIGLSFYAALCARSIARAHARSGDAVAISAYLGTSDKFDGAIADFADEYADQNARDYAEFKAAIADGRIEAAEG